VHAVVEFLNRAVIIKGISIIQCHGDCFSISHYLCALLMVAACADHNRRDLLKDALSVSCSLSREQSDTHHKVATQEW
jgi:hypothetical protein